MRDAYGNYTRHGRSDQDRNGRVSRGAQRVFVISTAGLRTISERSERAGRREEGLCPTLDPERSSDLVWRERCTAENREVFCRSDMAFILARKVKMEQRYEGDVAVPVTILEALPCTVTQVRTMERDGYVAVQVGAGNRRHVTKPMAGHLGAAGKVAVVREFPIPKDATFAVGDRIDADVFAVGDRVQVSATSKGKGFAGVMKRHHFHGQDSTHGTKDSMRAPGSIAGIGRGGGGPVSKGHRMAGRMGGDRKTILGLRVVAVDASTHELVINGAVPGARGALVELRTWGGSWK